MEETKANKQAKKFVPREFGVSIANRCPSLVSFAKKSVSKKGKNKNEK